MNYKKTLKAKQKQILQTRLISILNSSYNSLRSLQLQGVDISLFNDNSHNMKKLNNLNIIWISTAKRDNIINESVWINLISFSNLITLEFMSNFPLNVDDIRQLKSAFEVNRNGNKYQLKNLKLSIESNMECNREIVYIIDLLCLSLETIFLTGMKHINEQTSICRSLCECKNLMVLSFMYRNVFDVNDLYSNLDCYNLLHELSLYLNGILKVLSLEYGPLINYEWQDRYKNHINKYFKSLIYVKIGQNRIKTPIVSTVISPNVKCNQFCLSFNANT